MDLELLQAGNGTVLWGCDGRGVGRVVLNRPEVNNAYNGELIAGLHQALDGLAQEMKLRLVVLSAMGRHFQAGADLKWISALGRESESANIDASRATAELVRRLDNTTVPTLALVQGGCFGGGTGIVAACDMVLATEDALFSISEARWGLTPGIILPQLCRAVGLRHVRRYALSCERFDAAEALRIGLVHKICVNLGAESASMIESLLMNAPHATVATKRGALSVGLAQMSKEEFDALVHEHAHYRRAPEAQEGTASFLEKRPPAWYTQ